MAGLFEKDLLLIFKQKQTLLIFVLLACMMGFSMDGSFVIGYLTCLCSIFTISTISYDEMNNGYSFLLTLPIDRKTYVYEKYLYCFSISCCAWVFGVIVYFVVSLIKGEPVSPMEDIASALTLLPVAMLVGDLMIPLQLKFGAEKSRIALAAIAGAVVVLSLAMQNIGNRTGLKLDKVASFLDAMPVAKMILFLILAAALLTAASIAASLHIMSKKEF